MNELGIRLFRPTPRGGIDLIRKDAHSNRNGDMFGVEEHQLVFPIETSRRNSRACQPVERDVVEDVVACKALFLAVEDPRDQLITADVVVNHPCSETYWRVRNGIQSLRLVLHFERVSKSVVVEIVQ